MACVYIHYKQYCFYSMACVYIHSGTIWRSTRAVDFTFLVSFEQEKQTITLQCIHSLLQNAETETHNSYYAIRK